MSKKIYFSEPALNGNEEKYIKESMRNRTLAGDGLFTRKCSEWLEKATSAKKVLLTTSCTHASEITQSKYKRFF